MMWPGSRGLLPAGHDAAVDGENDAGDKTRLIGSEEQKRFRRIRRLAIAAERVHRLEGRQHGFHLLGRQERAEDRGLDNRWRYRVHADFERRQLDREVLDE